MTNLVERFKKELKSNQIYVPDQWIEKLISEESQINLSFNYFYKKWLDTNIMELDYSSVDIPDLIPEFAIPPTKVNLNSKFQIVQIQDITQPKQNDYCESLYFKKRDEDEDEDNLDDNENRRNQNKFNKPRNRQLLLTLFNGKKKIRALEFETINQLNFTNSYPGAKVLIKGEVELSFGIIMLRKENVDPLGGIRLESEAGSSNRAQAGSLIICLILLVNLFNCFNY